MMRLLTLGLLGWLVFAGCDAEPQSSVGADKAADGVDGEATTTDDLQKQAIARLLDNVDTLARLTNHTFSPGSADVSFPEELWISPGSYYTTGQYWNRSGVKPSEVIEDFFSDSSKNIYSHECAAPMDALLYKTLLDLIGASLFDAIWLAPEGKDHGPMTLGAADLRNGRDPNLACLRQYLYPDDDPGRGKQPAPDTFLDEIAAGDMIYVVNWSAPRECIDRGFSGENLIHVRDGLYYGHGIGDRDDGLVELDQVIKVLDDCSRPDEGAPGASVQAFIGRLDIDRLSQWIQMKETNPKQLFPADERTRCTYPGISLD